MHRFDDELEQICLKHSIGGRKNRQHASREDILRMNIKRELEEYNTCGIEIPNFLDKNNFLLVRQWNGELRYLQNIKLKRYGKKHLEALINNAKTVVDKNRIKSETKIEDKDADNMEVVN